MMYRSFVRAILVVCVLTAMMIGLSNAETVPSLDGDHIQLQPLPLDDYTVFGPAVDPEAMTADGYSGPSIQVTMYQEWIDDTHYNVAHVKIAHPSQLRTALARNSVKNANYIWVTAEKNNAVVAIGGECLSWNGGSYTVRMGNTLRKHGFKRRDTLIIDQNGDFHIFKGFSKDVITWCSNQGIQIVNLFNFGPALVINGEQVYEQVRNKKYPVGPVSGYHPRTAIGQLGPLEYLLVVADGRGIKVMEPDGSFRRSKGINVYALGDYMSSKGCIQAYTLDGGGSAAMYYAKTGVYSSPCSKRAVTDIVYFAALPIAQVTHE